MSSVVALQLIVLTRTGPTPACDQVPPPPGTLYFNMIRNPIKRWVSLHDFHVSNQAPK